MNSVKPLDVTLSVTMVDPGCSRSMMADMSAMKRLLERDREHAETAGINMSASRASYCHCMANAYEMIFSFETQYGC